MIYAVLEYVVLLTAVVGVLLNNHKLIWCFPVWLVSNSISSIVHYHGGMDGMVLRDGAFIVLAVHGWIVWQKKKHDA